MKDAICITERFECPLAKHCQRHISQHPKPITLRAPVQDFGAKVPNIRRCPHYKPKAHDDTK